MQQATKGDHLPDLTGEDDEDEEMEGITPSKAPKPEVLSRSEAQKKVGEEELLRALVTMTTVLVTMTTAATRPPTLQNQHYRTNKQRYKATHQHYRTTNSISKNNKQNTNKTTLQHHNMPRVTTEQVQLHRAAAWLLPHDMPSHCSTEIQYAKITIKPNLTSMVMAFISNLLF